MRAGTGVDRNSGRTRRISPDRSECRHSQLRESESSRGPSERTGERGKPLASAIASGEIDFRSEETPRGPEVRINGAPHPVLFLPLEQCLRTDRGSVVHDLIPMLRRMPIRATRDACPRRIFFSKDFTMGNPEDLLISIILSIS